MAAFVGVLEKEHIENFLEFCLNKWNANRQSTMIVAVVVSIMYRFMENSLISISMLSIKKYVLIY